MSGDTFVHEPYNPDENNDPNTENELGLENPDSTSSDRVEGAEIDGPENVDGEHVQKTADEAQKEAEENAENAEVLTNDDGVVIDNPNAMNYVPGNPPVVQKDEVVVEREGLPYTSDSYEAAHEVVKGDPSVDGPYLDDIRRAENHKYREVREKVLHAADELSEEDSDEKENSTFAEETEDPFTSVDRATDAAGNAVKPPYEYATKNQGDDQNAYGQDLNNDGENVDVTSDQALRLDSTASPAPSDEVAGVQDDGSNVEFENSDEPGHEEGSTLQEEDNPSDPAGDSISEYDKNQ